VVAYILSLRDRQPVPVRQALEGKPLVRRHSAHVEGCLPCFQTA
jgi:hypothetical protein